MRLIALARNSFEERPLTRPGRQPTRINGVVDKLREVWTRHQELRLAQLDSFESRKQSDET